MFCFFTKAREDILLFLQIDDDLIKVPRPNQPHSDPALLFSFPFILLGFLPAQLISNDLLNIKVCDNGSIAQKIPDEPKEIGTIRNSTWRAKKESLFGEAGYLHLTAKSGLGIIPAAGGRDFLVYSYTPMPVAIVDTRGMCCFLTTPEINQPLEAS